MAVADTKSYPVEFVVLNMPADINKMIPMALRSGCSVDVNARPADVLGTRVVEIGGNPTGGTFTLFDKTGVATTTLAYNAAPADVQTALDTLLGAGKVTVSGTVGTYIVEGDVGKLTATQAFTGGSPPPQPRISVNEYRVTITRPGAIGCTTTIRRYLVMDGDRIHDMDAVGFTARYTTR